MTEAEITLVVVITIIVCWQIGDLARALHSIAKAINNVAVQLHRTRHNDTNWPEPKL